MAKFFSRRFKADTILSDDPEKTDEELIAETETSIGEDDNFESTKQALSQLAEEDEEDRAEIIDSVERDEAQDEELFTEAYEEAKDDILEQLEDATEDDGTQILARRSTKKRASRKRKSVTALKAISYERARCLRLYKAKALASRLNVRFDVEKAIRTGASLKKAERSIFVSALKKNLTTGNKLQWNKSDMRADSSIMNIWAQAKQGQK